MNIYTKMLLGLDGRNVWLCFGLLHFLRLSNAVILSFVFIHIFVFKDLIFGPAFFKQILIFIVNFLYKDSMAFDRPAIIVHSQNISC